MCFPFKMAIWGPGLPLARIPGLQRTALRALCHGVTEQLSQFGAAQLSAARHPLNG